MRSYPVFRNPLFNVIKRAHGALALHLSRTLERSHVELERAWIKLRFLIRCRDYGVLPVSFRLRTGLTLNKRTKKILREAGFSLLRNTIKEHRDEIAWLNQSLNWQKTALIAEIGYDFTMYFIHLVKCSISQFVSNEKRRLENKFHTLVCSRTWEFMNSRRSHGGRQGCNLNTEKAVVNLSARPLTTEETVVLAKGLNFVPTKKRIDYMDIIGRVEYGIRDENQSRANHIRSLIADCLVRYKHCANMNLPTSTLKAIKDLRNEQSIIITKADKGNVTAVLDRETYNSKVMELLSCDTYAPLMEDPTERTRKSLKITLSTLMEETKEKSLSTLTRKMQFSSNFTCPELFCLPKIHKENIPFRPVVSSCRSVTRGLCVYIKKLLGPISGHRTSHTKNSVDFVNEIRNISIEEDDIMVSYDVKDLFTSVPLPHTYSVIQDLLSMDISLHERTRLNPFQITQLIKFCMEEGNYFHWNGRFCRQREGAPMGSPLSPVLAEIFMEDLEKRAFPRGIPEHGLKLFKRYVDDIFAIVKRGKEDVLLSHLNNIFPNKIFFTMEKEKEGELPFLDVHVIRMDKQLKTKVYRKPTHSGIYLNFTSNHPIGIKKGIIIGMVDRAFNICSEEFLAEEIRHIRLTLLRNNYPNWLINEYIDRRIDKWKNQTITRRRDDDTATRIILPYYPGLAEFIQRRLKTVGIKAVFSSLMNLRSILRTDILKTNPEDRPGAIYLIKCGCRASYFGETGHGMHHRFEQHLAGIKRYRNAERRLRGENITGRGRPQIKDPNDIMSECISGSSVVEHVVGCTQPDDSLRVIRLRNESNYFIRKTEEALFIRHNPCINREDGYTISDIWNLVVSKTSCCQCMF